MRTPRCSLYALMFLATVGNVRVAQGQDVEWTVGASTAAGRYIFDQTTLTHVLTLGSAVSGDRWRLGASLPVIVQNSSAVTFIGGTPLPTGGGGGGPLAGRGTGERLPMRRRATTLVDGPQPAATAIDSIADEPGPYTTQLGDPVISASRTWGASQAGPHRITTNLFVKLPLADPNSGVGTGALDAGASLSYGYAAGRTFLFADAGWWHIGDLPALPLRDIASGSVGIGRALGAAAKWTALASVSGATPIVDNLDAPLSAGVLLGYLTSAERSWSLGISLGLSEASPDWSASLGWRLSRSR